ncbi:MAG: hypothetical protein B6I28_03850 [Fusobacteriia bacterium 4572_132]|nr:MAG: hypothetical protein B6I28_03850 [Fusobacteriia bacterium 4572_132]
MKLIKELKEQLNTYSICYDDEITGENTYAALASQHLNTITGNTLIAKMKPTLNFAKSPNRN